jgi:protein tyrosine phosphatase (PTP) superfamily phosphohydrolase (DUF442 family)
MGTIRRHRFGGLAAALLLAATAAIGADSPQTAMPLRDKPRDLPGLQNVLHLSDRIYSGSQPEGEEGFASLAKLGIRTIVSVDGARPNVELARKYGLSYIHVPIGYDGISPQAGKALAATIRTTEGPIYYHCHHGKHRGPSAAAAACVAEGSPGGPEAVKVLTLAGTGKEYAGLWRDVAAYVPPRQGEKLPELVSVSEVGSLTRAMVEIDQAADRIKLCEKAGWAAPRDHTDLSPDHEILILQESLHEAGRNCTKGRPKAFVQELDKTEQGAARLRETVAAGKAREASAAFAALQNNCTQCHASYRN